MSESFNLDESLRRRSPRFSSPKITEQSGNNMAAKRASTLKKTHHRKTSGSNKENTPGSKNQENPKVSTPSDVCTRRSASSLAKKRPAMPSPILPFSSPPESVTTSQNPDPDAAMWSRKVRRSYSKLGDQSFSSPESRENLFGFEKLQTPEVFRKPKAALPQVTSGGLNLFMNFLQEVECESGYGTAAGPGLGPEPEPDTNIPGVALVKEKKRRKKVQQIDDSELDEMAAKMNAEFEEAEEFELVVE